MKKLIKWLSESNRWKHLVGGAALMLISPNLLSGSWGVLVGASALEFKDSQWGGKWDWIDWSMTLLGGLIGSIRYIF